MQIVTRPNEIQIDNAFATVSTYQLVDNDNDDMELKDAFGRVLVTLVKADAYKARMKVRNMMKTPQQQQQNQLQKRRPRQQNDFFNPNNKGINGKGRGGLNESPNQRGQVFCPHFNKYHN